jgi:Fic family protein
MDTYIYQNKDWPNFTWNYERISGILGTVRNLQGKLVGKMEALGFSLREEALLETLTIDVLKSTEIEGVILPSDQVRSSIARHLGMDVAGLVPSDRYVEGVVQMTLDATQHAVQPLTSDRLFNWQAALFPTGIRSPPATGEKTNRGQCKLFRGVMEKKGCITRLLLLLTLKKK